MRVEIGTTARSFGAVLLLALGDDPQRFVRQRPLKFQRVDRLALKPLVNLGGRRQNDRHRLGVNRRDDRVGVRRQEADRSAKAKSGLSSARANQIGVLAGLRVGVLAE
jgi:hypothetical protein